jgi:iron complex transport system ATP-binding protein
MLEARNISASYESTEVLHDVSFVLGSGEILAILGPNGAGKTSLIRTLNGTLPVSHGEVLNNGIEISKHSRAAIARSIAVVAQENETKFPITVLEFVLAGRFAHGGVFGWESDEDISKASAALEQCDLAAFRDRLMNELSGGERQRVVLARALATGASTLLLDEPTANLDIAHQALMFRLVRYRCREHGYSAVVITHDLNLASEFADSVILLKNGHVEAMGSPYEVLTEENISSVFRVNVLLDQNPSSRKLRVTNLY